MTWLRSLDELDVANLRAVGHKAYHLSVLRQQGLPVAQGWVLTAAAWHHSLAQMPWPESTGDRLAPLTQGGFQALQHTSQQWQQALREIPAIAPAPADWQSRTSITEFVPAAWMLRASVWMEAKSRFNSTIAAASGLLAAQIEADFDALPQVLPQFWSQALTARCLVVWAAHCQHLQDLSLATLIMPVYPALVSGTLTFAHGQAQVAVVEGLGLALSQGEAIPARCCVSQGRVADVVWEVGFQERRHQLMPASKYRSRQTTIAQAIQVVQRDRPELSPPLDNAQLAQLLAIGDATQSALNTPSVRLEWLLYPGPNPSRPTLVITQADPWIDSAGVAPPPRPRRQPPLLPLASTVVQGIGASAGRAQGVAVVAQTPQDLPKPLPPRCVVVLPDLQPDVFLQLGTIAGIVTERGGATCHAAILAREMGIPAVVGAPQATQLLDDGMVLWLDGDRGVVYGLPEDAATDRRFQAAIAQVPPASATVGSLSVEQWSRYRRLTTKVMINLSQTRQLSALPLDHIAGVGLLRSEWLLLDILEGRHPWDWINRGQEAELQGHIVQQLEPILQALGNKPLRYRSLDLRSHEWQGLAGSPPVEPNPMLGLRGTLSYDIDDRLFQVELGALATLQRAGYTNLQLILPFVRTVEEVIACRQPIEQAGLRDYNDFALWIMAEVPSVLFLLPAYAKAGVQGIAIGSNDLTQLLLAVDRDQPIMASAYDERHPVVRLAMAHLVQEAERCGLLCSICGQAPVRHPELIADLVAWGIGSISVEAAALPFTLESVWQAEQSGAEVDEQGSGARGVRE
ncbi:putative PEP-binding protein [Nodosilinea sp. E11]|uniref:putative PEP-binding protein n=1 Tax=Nodosilinea sp. E11 TaxID=3037479 RepID=UPI0029342660|nr:putative PEP-binding protein [Nodosilinea sp. E11]WOD38304.1 putative PEP-binding protein [Nodosilinea sp. E11]